jgi:hypothetical protein
MAKSAPRKAPARKTRGASKGSAKGQARKRQTPQKLAAKLRNNIAAETVRESHRMMDAQFEPFSQSQVPETLRILAERNVAQARQVYESSKNTLQAVLESWQKSFGVAGQGATALNRRVTDLAERNINSGFELATDLAGARNFAEVMELQATYWRKLLGELQTNQRERAASSKNRRSSRSQ